MLLLSALTGGFVYILVGAKAINGSIGIGNVLLTYSAVIMLIKALTDFAMTFTDLRNNNEHLLRYFDYVSLEEETGAADKSVDCNYAQVNIDNVSFKYPGSKNYALKNVSLFIENGQKVAIVGANGSGKTTLVKLICGLYDVTKGSIKINDTVVTARNRNEFGKWLSAVFQDFSLLALPIGNNISAGKLYDESKVWKALEKVGIREKIEKYPEKLEQSLFKDYDDDGVELSGGEAQKIAIARGIYKDAALIILDGNEAYKQVLYQGAKSLSTRFNPAAGVIRSWDFVRKGCDWKFPVIIDNMMNLELLLSMSKAYADDSLQNIACTHANTTIQHHFRDDYSTYHLVDYDPETGAVRGKQTVQGFSDDSSWSRGQAWALYRYTMMFRLT